MISENEDRDKVRTKQSGGEQSYIIIVLTNDCKTSDNLIGSGLMPSIAALQSGGNYIALIKLYWDRKLALT